MNLTTYFEVTDRWNWNNKIKLAVLQSNNIEVETSQKWSNGNFIHQSNSYYGGKKVLTVLIKATDAQSKQSLVAEIYTLLFSEVTVKINYEGTITNQTAAIITNFNKLNQTFLLKGGIFYKPNATEGDFSLSFPNIKPFQFKFSYSEINSDKTGSVAFYNEDSNIIQGKFNLTPNKIEVDTKLSLTTPFFFNFLCINSDTVSTLHALLEFNQSQFELRGEVDNTKGNLTITTPLTMITFLNISFEQNNTNRKLSGILKQELQTYQLEIRSQEQSKKGSLNINLTTPIQHYKRLSLVLSYDYSLPNASFTASWSKDSRVYAMNGWLRSNFKTSQGELSVTMETPISGYEHIQLKADFDFVKLEKTAKINLQGLYETDITLEYNMLLLPYHGTFALQLSTPISTLRKASVSGKYDITNDKSTVNFTSILNEKSIKLSGISYSTPYKHMVELSLQTPFQEFQSVKFSAATEFTPTTKKGEIVLQVNNYENKVYAILNMPSVLHAQVETGIDIAFLSLKLTSQYNFRKPSKFIQLQLTDNFHTLISLEVEGSFSLLKSDINAKLSLPKAEYKSLLDGSIDLTEKTKIGSITIDVNGELSRLSTELTVDESMIELLIKTPLQGFQKISFRAGLETSQSTTAWFLTYENESKSEVVLSISRDNETSEGRLHLITPFHQPISIETKVRAKRELNFIANVSDRKIEITGKFHKEENLVKLTLKTPFTDWEETEAEIKFLFDQNNKNIYLTWKHGGERKTISVTTNITSKSFTIKIETPFDQLRKAYLSIKKYYSDESAIVEIQGKLEFAWNKYLLRMKRSFSPLKVMVDVKLDCDYGSIFSGKFSYDFIEEQKHILLKVQVYEETLLEFSTDITVNSETYSQSINFNTTLLPKDITAKAQIDFVRAKGDLNISTKYNVGEASNEVKIYIHYKNDKFMFSFNSSYDILYDFKVTITWKINEDEIEILAKTEIDNSPSFDIRFNHNYLHKTGEILLKITDDEKHMLNYNWTEDGNYKASYLVTVRTETYKIMSMTGNQKSAKILCSLYGNEDDITIDISWGGYDRNYKAYVSIRVKHPHNPNKYFITNINYERTGNNEVSFLLEQFDLKDEERNDWLHISMNLKSSTFNFKFQFDHHTEFSIDAFWQPFLDFTIKTELETNARQMLLSLDSGSSNFLFRYKCKNGELLIESEFASMYKGYVQIDNSLNMPSPKVLSLNYEVEIDEDEFEFDFKFILDEYFLKSNGKIDEEGGTIFLKTSKKDKKVEFNGEWRQRGDKASGEFNLKSDYNENDISLNYQLSYKERLSGQFSSSYGEKKVSGSIDGILSETSGDITLHLASSNKIPYIDINVSYNLETAITFKAQFEYDINGNQDVIQFLIEGTDLEGKIKLNNNSDAISGEYINKPGHFYAGFPVLWQGKTYKALEIQCTYSEDDIAASAKWNKESMPDVVSAEFTASSLSETNKVARLKVLAPLTYFKILDIQLDRNVDIEGKIVENKVDVTFREETFHIYMLGSLKAPTYGVKLEITGTQSPYYVAEMLYTEHESLTAALATYTIQSKLEIHANSPNFKLIAKLQHKNRNIIDVLVDLDKEIKLDIALNDKSVFFEAKWVLLKHGWNFHSSVNIRKDQFTFDIAVDYDDSYIYNPEEQTHRVDKTYQITVQHQPVYYHSQLIIVKPDRTIERTDVVETPEYKTTTLQLTDKTGVKMQTVTDYKDGREGIMDMNYDLVLNAFSIIMTGEYVNEIESYLNYVTY